MYRRFLFVLFLALQVFTAFAQESEQTIPRMDDGRFLTGRIAELERNPHFSQKYIDHLSQEAVVFVHNYDQVFLEVDLTANLVDSTFSAIAQFNVRSEIADMVSLDFHLQDTVTVDSIFVAGVKRDFSRSDDTEMMSLEPRLALNAIVTVDLAGLEIQLGDLVELTIYYRGRILDLPDTGINYQWGTNAHPQPDVLYSYNEPHLARLWLPSYDYPGDKFDSTRIKVTMPHQFTVVSNGLLESEVQQIVGEDTLKTTSWLNSYPISTYLISIAAKADYVMHDAGTAGVNDTPVQYWLYPEWYYFDPSNPPDYTLEGALYDLERTPQMLELFESLFGPYPFKKYGQALAPIGGAMEHQSATTLGTYYAGAGDRVGEVTVAHELSHQWWGDWVGPATFKDMWLNEGFATYCEAIWVEEVYPLSFNQYMIYLQDTAKLLDANTDYPVSNPPFPYIVSLVYDKGGVVLHMLRLEVGDEAFFNALASYGAAHAYGSATTAEFQAAMEAESGMDLTAFFDQWVNGKYWPQFDLRHFWSEPDDEGYYDTYLILDQTQEWDQLFETSMPIRLRSLVSRDQDTVFVAHIDAARSDTVYLGKHAWQPKALVFNFKSWVLCDFNSSSMTGVEIADDSQLPAKFDVSNAWPNPFNGSASFELALPSAADVDVEVVNMLGRRVTTLAGGWMSAGTHRMSWSPAHGLASGVYLIRVEAAGQQFVKRVTLVR